MLFSGSAKTARSKDLLKKNLNKSKRSGKVNDRSQIETTNDDPSKIGTGAIKYDAGKPCAFRGLIGYFPRASLKVAEVSTFGANKYAWNGWEKVDDGVARYSDAMTRHLLYEAKGEHIDPDSGIMHAAHAAWGALARLELMLRKDEGLARLELSLQGKKEGMIGG
jgi:hypothetical protein